MSSTVKGVYRNGHVQLLEKPHGMTDGDVEVTLTSVDRGDGSLRARRERVRLWLQEEGWNLGGAPYPIRDELHDRTRWITA
jgi:hypothetical protein